MLTCDKAISEQGERLNIRKATLRDWRREFARHLRAQGVAANATERAPRGQNRTPIRDGLYQAARHQRSHRLRERAEQIARDLRRGGLPHEPGREKLLQTRAAVIAGWQAAAERLLTQGHPTLAKQVHQFVDRMTPPRTGNERLARSLLDQLSRKREREQAAINR